jgi:hypothetical protein
MPLPITSKIDRRARPQRQPDRAGYLIPIAHPAVVLAPSGLLGVTDQVWTGDMMVMPNFAAPHAGEKRLSAIRVNAIQRISFLVIDPVHFVTSVQIVP